MYLVQINRLAADPFFVHLPSFEIFLDKRPLKPRILIMTCMSFLTTSLPTTWSKMAWSLASSIRQNLTRSLCQVSRVPGSSAVTLTWENKCWIESGICLKIFHLEILVRGDSEPLRRVQELILVDKMQGATRL